MIRFFHFFSFTGFLLAVLLFQPAIPVLHAQVSFPGVVFEYDAVEVLSDTTGVYPGFLSQWYHYRTGGVAFDAVAQPADGVKPADVKLRYDAGSRDQRITVSLDGNEVAIPIPLWIAIPAARFVDSEVKTCMTLFHRLADDDGTRTRNVYRQGGKVIGLHESVRDRCIGWRLWQVDKLLMGSNSRYLPRYRGDYLLCAGEHEPDLASGFRGWLALELFNEQFWGDNAFRSYIISDYEQTITFSAGDGQLNLTGLPYWRFWKALRDYDSYDERHIEDSIRRVLRDERLTQNEGRQTQLTPFHRNRAVRLTRHLHVIAGEHDDRVPSPLSLAISLDQYELEKLLIDAETRAHGDSVVHLDEYSQALAARPELIRNICPQVYDATTSFMRIAAFYRWVKKHHPASWQSFLRQIRYADSGHIIRTPTVMLPVD
ncbi:hypothetical protein KQI65_00470 [bacterium]|nr:hypothetical protein [bacterium]